MAEFATLTHPLDKNFEGQLPEIRISQDFENKGINWINELMKHTKNDEFYKNLSNVPSQKNWKENNTNIDIPIFHVGSW